MRGQSMTRSMGSRVILGLAVLTVFACVPALKLAHGQAGVASIKARVDLPAARSGIPEISLTVPSNGQASAFFVVANDSDRKIERLKILNLLVPETGYPGSAPRITIASAGAKPEQESWTIEPHQGLPMTLTVASLDPSASPVGLLLGTVGDAEYTVLARVKLERAGGQIRFLGLGADGGLNIDLSVGTLKRRLTAETTGTAVFDLDLVVTSFDGPDGAQLTPEVRVSGCVEPAQAKAEKGIIHVKVHGPGYLYVDLEATGLSAAGTYTGGIELRPSKAASARAQLTLTRTRGAPPVEMKPPDPVRDATYTWWWEDATEVRVYLKETGGRTVGLNPPVYVSLSRKEGAGKVQAQAVAGGVLDGDGHAITTFPIVLMPGETRVLRVPISPLREPGEYSGLLRFGSPDYLALEQPVTIVKRLPALVAALVILTGIAGSFLQRTFFSRTLPRKQQVRDAAKLILRLREALGTLPPLTDAEQEVAKGLADLFKDLHDTADGRQPARDRLTLASKRLDLFLQEVPARVMVDSVRPQDGLDDFRKRLTTSLSVITSEATTAAQCQTALEDLGKLPENLIAAVRTSLSQQMDTFSKEVAVQMNATDAVKPALRERVVVPLGQALAGLPTKGRISELQQVRDVYDRARGNYVQILSGALKQVVTGPKPPGFSDAGWRKLSDEDVGPDLDAAIRESGTDPGAALTDYNRAFVRYVRDAAAHLLGAANRLRQDLALVPPDEMPDQKTTREREKERLDNDIIGPLKGVPDKLKAGNAQEAAGDYRTALAVYRDPLAAAAGPSLAADALGPVFLFADRVASRPTRDVQALRPAVIDPATEVASIDRLVSNAQWAMLGIVLVLGTLSGLQTLWAVDPTWGSWADLAAVFVWGAGLQQIAGFTADQISDAIEGAVR